MEGCNPNGLRIMWYINGADGDVPWQPERRSPPSLAHLRNLAATLDRLGYFGALSTARETIALIGDTQRLRFMIPEYPGVKPRRCLPKRPRSSTTTQVGA